MNPESPKNQQNTDRETAGASNVVRYERRAGQRMRLEGTAETTEVLFIDENTPIPSLPQRQPYVPVSRRRPGGEDVFYIGPE
jgi:hypothetical protein